MYSGGGGGGICHGEGNFPLSMLQDYTATIFLRQRWTDERLVFEGNKSLSLDGRLVELLWVPDTFIVDSKKSFLHDITVENRLIRIFPNGTVLYALRWEIRRPRQAMRGSGNGEAGGAHVPYLNADREEIQDRCFMSGKLQTRVFCLFP